MNLFFPILYLILTAIITLLPMIAKPVETAIGFCMILASVPVYIVFLVWKGKPKWLGNILGEGTNWLQRLLVVMPQVNKYIQNCTNCKSKLLHTFSKSSNSTRY